MAKLEGNTKSLSKVEIEPGTSSPTVPLVIHSATEIYECNNGIELFQCYACTV